MFAFTAGPGRDPQLEGKGTGLFVPALSTCTGLKAWSQDSNCTHALAHSTSSLLTPGSLGFSLCVGRLVALALVAYRMLVRNH